ncbi:dUTP diphosphatase [Brevibacterium celere]
MDVPAYAHAADAGADLCSTIDFVLEPFARRLVPTGIALALPVGYAGFVHPRSGLSSRHGVTVVNAPGTIDAGYRGEIKVPLINLDPHTAMTISRGDRIAQLVIQEIRQADFRLVPSLGTSDRGEGGFGSTGGVGAGLSTEGV